MILPALLVASVLASSTPAVRLASPGFSYVSVDEKTGDFLADFFSQQLEAQGGIRVTTKNEISALVGFERQKQLLGCADAERSCLAELAGALGVDGLITGTLAKTKRGLVITLTIVAANDARSLAGISARVEDEDALLDLFIDRAPAIAASVRSALGQGAAAPPPRPAPDAPVARRSDPPPPKEAAAPAAPPTVAAAATPRAAPGQPSRSAGPSLRVVIPGAIGGVLLASGGVFYGMAFATKTGLDDGTATVRSKEQLVAALETGRNQQLTAAVLAGGGAIAGVIAAVLFVAEARPPQVSVAPVPGGATVSITGVLP